MADTYFAECVALTQLQGDALITLDAALADAVKHLVTVAPIEAVLTRRTAGASLRRRD